MECGTFCGTCQRRWCSKEKVRWYKCCTCEAKIGGFSEECEECMRKGDMRCVVCKTSAYEELEEWGKDEAAHVREGLALGLDERCLLWWYDQRLRARTWSLHVCNSVHMYVRLSFVCMGSCRYRCAHVCIV